jgi:hypothetical protein
MLEQQQVQLVDGLRELYGRLLKGESWPGRPLYETSGGHPLTNDILKRLALIRPFHDDTGHCKDCNESSNQIQQELVEIDASLTVKRASANAASEHCQALSPSPCDSIPITESISFDDLFVHNVPQTPTRSNCFSRQLPGVSPVSQATPAVSSTPIGAVSVHLSVYERPIWPGQFNMMDEPADFRDPTDEFDNFSSHCQTTKNDRIVIDRNDSMVPNWNGADNLDYFSFTQSA